MKSSSSEGSAAIPLSLFFFFAVLLLSLAGGGGAHQNEPVYAPGVPPPKMVDGELNNGLYLIKPARS